MSKSSRTLPILPICLVIGLFAVEKPDFSGTYAAKQKKNSESMVLHVVQNDSGVEVTRTVGGKSNTNRFPLDGSEGEFTTETGVRGKCKAEIKKQTLVLESLVASPGNTNGPSMRFLTVEQWLLSRDGKTLTIKTEIKSPDSPAEVMGLAFPNNLFTEKYLRTDKP
jgi:hypothetical protein